MTNRPHPNQKTADALRLRIEKIRDTLKDIDEEIFYFPERADKHTVKLIEAIAEKLGV